jgi:acyl-CoA thioester hydrolase
MERPAPWRLVAASYPRAKAVPIRFSDIDMFRHLNNVAAGAFYEEARFELLDEVQRLVPKDERAGLVIAHVGTSFLGQARYPGTIDVMTGVSQIGERSFTIGQGLFVDGKCISVADSVVAAVDAKGACAVPGAIRGFLESVRFAMGGASFRS